MMDAAPEKPHSFIFVHFLALGLVFAAMLAWTWFAWPDALVDFGREIYVPWQLAQGKVLYRDIAYFNGPLSPYFNSIVFRLLGVSLRTIVLVNLLLLAGMTWMIWRLLAEIADALSATVACIVLLTVFSFVQFVGIGNYNFVTPYSHEITHGIVLSFAAMICLEQFIDKRKTIFAVLTGFILGIVFLTKAEVFLASAAAIGIGFLLSRPPAKPLVGFVVGFLIPPIIALIALMTVMPISEAFRGVLGSWVYVFDPNIRDMYFYRRIMGVLNLRQNWELSGWTCLVYAAILLPTILVGWLVRRGTGIVLTISSIAAIGAFYLMKDNLSPWQSALRGLTIVSPLLAIGASVLAIIHPRPQRILRAVISIFAAVLLAKIFFNVTAFQYGFALAMPATLVAIVAALNWLPDMLTPQTPPPGTLGEGGGEGSARRGKKTLTLTLSRSTGRGDQSARAILLPVVGLFIFVHLFIFNRYYASKPTTVAQGADAFYADPVSPPFDVRGRAENLMLATLSQLPADRTLAVFPEGSMLNYLSGRMNPTPYLSVMPPELAMFGEDRIVREYAAHPPDLIVMMIHGDLSDYGYKGFGADFGQEIFQWVKANYVQIPTAQEPRFPMVLLARR